MRIKKIDSYIKEKAQGNIPQATTKILVHEKPDLFFFVLEFPKL